MSSIIILFAVGPSYPLDPSADLLIHFLLKPVTRGSQWNFHSLLHCFFYQLLFPNLFNSISSQNPGGSAPSPTSVGGRWRGVGLALMRADSGLWPSLALSSPILGTQLPFLTHSSPPPPRLCFQPIHLGLQSWAGRIPPPLPHNHLPVATPWEGASRPFPIPTPDDWATSHEGGDNMGVCVCYYSQFSGSRVGTLETVPCRYEGSYCI